MFQDPSGTAEKSLARAHYEQHVGGSGIIEVGDEQREVKGHPLECAWW
jgi:hypothetical protein